MSTANYNMWVCDFETTTDPLDCRVWAYGAYNIYTHEWRCGNSISLFMDFLNEGTKKIYFQNAAFDCEFLMTELYRRDYKYNFTKSKNSLKEFKTIISDTGLFYQLKVTVANNVYITILDSLKIIPLPVRSIPKAFGLKDSKGDIDYNKDRPIGYEITKEEEFYIYRDCKIVAQALEFFLDKGMVKMTQGANALQDFINVIGGKNRFRSIFPKLNEDTDNAIRKAYRGGFTYLNPKYKEVTVINGAVYDVNSLYPYSMTKELPYGEPIHFDGKYEYDGNYPLYTQDFICMFDLKDGYLPTVQIKNSSRFIETEYLSSSNGEEVFLSMTSIDLELFLEHYNVYNLTYLEGYKFRSMTGIFDEYINKWSEIKINSKLVGNKGMYTISKLMLTSLYGKFGTSPRVKSKIPIYDDKENRLRYKLAPEEHRDAVYIPVACFITAQARKITISAAQKCYDTFIYADTDSLHLSTQEPPDIEIDSTKLGAWDYEMEFDKAKYIRSKTYMEHGRRPGTDDEYTWQVKCAGMPDKCKENVTFDNFKPGSVYEGKLQTKRVSGGTVLIETSFTIKA